MGSKHLEKKFVLDTCAWIWISIGDKRINKKTQDKLFDSDWLISAISVWEVAMLASKKKIIFNVPIERWIKEALTEAQKLSLVPLSPEISILSCDIKENIISDPADKIIIATAFINNAAIVTGDKKIIDYCNSGNLPVIAV